jgi:hypothetical protein
MQARICELREELLRLTRELVGLPMPGEKAAPKRRRSTARHAAAVLLAVGCISGASQGCIFDGGVFEAPPYDYDAAGRDRDAGDSDGRADRATPRDAGGWIDDEGVFEAPPQDR